MVKQIIKEAMEKNAIGLKEAVEAELQSRIQLALEAKKKHYSEEESDEESDDDHDEDDEDEMDEEAQPKWKVAIGNKHYTVTARNTMEASKKAKMMADKEKNAGVPGKIEKISE
jgi:CRISPR/Cas system-associated protein Cas5 (RAMP superfamily)